MKCPECGYDSVPKGSGVCTKCGTAIAEGPTGSGQTTVTQRIRNAVRSTIIGVQNQFFAPQDAHRYRHILLKAIRRRWFDEQGDSLIGAAPVELRMMERLDLLGQKPNQLLPAGMKIVEVFDNVDRKLLILGEPGSGKKEKLLELAYALIERAEEGDDPMPVVLSLISWSSDYHTDGFFDWLVEEISDKHDSVGTELCKEWLKDRQLALLLDDLDRVEQKYQEASVSVINDFLKKWDPVWIAICSRTHDYEALSPRLRFGGAVELQRLTIEEVNTYLADPELAALRSLLEDDRTLQDLATSPLYLSIMSDVYRGRPIEAVQPFDSIEARCRELWIDYVDCAFARRGDDKRYGRKQAEGWLTWLAQSMEKHKQDLFLIEKMQPDWLPTSLQRWHTIGSWLVTGLVFGLPVGLAFGLAFAEGVGLTPGLTAGSALGLTLGLLGGLAFFGLGRRLIFGPVVGLISGLAVGLACGLAFGPSRGLALGAIAAVAGLSFGLLPSGLTADRRRIRVIETLNWSWPRAILGLAAGTGSALAAGVVVGMFTELADGLSLGLFVGSFVGPALAVIGGMTGGEIQVEDKEVPNQGIHRSAKNAIRVGLLAGLVFGLPIGLAGPTIGHIHIGANIGVGGLSDGLALGLTLGIGLGLAFGGITCIQHAVLRLILFFQRHIPWDYVDFLEYARDLGFLKRHGGAYEFRHPQLQDYFAKLGSE